MDGRLAKPRALMQSPADGRRMRCVAVALVSTAAATWSVASTPSPCYGSALAIAAQVASVEPRGAQLHKRTDWAADVPASVGDFICRGESVHLAVGGPVTRAELFVNGEMRVLTAGSRFDAPTGLLAVGSGALSFLSRALEGLSTLRSPPDVPKPTAPRGGGGGDALDLPVKRNRLLDRLPRQSFVGGLPLIVSWRDGTGPYRCEATSGAGELLSTKDAEAQQSWCELSAPSGDLTQAHARDARGKAVSWGVRTVAWRDVPTPPWWTSSAVDGMPGDAIAWAWWLWTSAGPEWRLQALSMLHRDAERIWLAGYLRNIVLAEATEALPR